MIVRTGTCIEFIKKIRKLDRPAPGPRFKVDFSQILRVECGTFMFHGLSNGEIYAHPAINRKIDTGIWFQVTKEWRLRLIVHRQFHPDTASYWMLLNLFWKFSGSLKNHYLNWHMLWFLVQVDSIRKLINHYHG